MENDHGSSLTPRSVICHTRIDLLIFACHGCLKPSLRCARFVENEFTQFASGTGSQSHTGNVNMMLNSKVVRNFLPDSVSLNFYENVKNEDVYCLTPSIVVVIIWENPISKNNSSKWAPIFKQTVQSIFAIRRPFAHAGASSQEQGVKER